MLKQWQVCARFEELGIRITDFLNTRHLVDITFTKLVNNTSFKYAQTCQHLFYLENNSLYALECPFQCKMKVLG